MKSDNKKATLFDLMIFNENDDNNQNHLNTTTIAFQIYSEP